MGHVRDCGVRAVAAATGRGYDSVKAEFLGSFATYCLVGSQMREYLTARGWSWTNTQREGAAGIPDTPSTKIVVTRRGFYALVHREANMRIDAPVCGYYEREVS